MKSYAAENIDRDNRREHVRKRRPNVRLEKFESAPERRITKSMENLGPCSVCGQPVMVAAGVLKNTDRAKITTCRPECTRERCGVEIAEDVDDE